MKLKFKSNYKLAKRLLKGSLFILIIISLSTFAQPIYAEAKTDPYVIVIDPGHGGENLGADHAGYIEKDMTMVVASAMKEELSKYEGVEVYLTHEDDIDMSLKERAKYAASKNADFMFCLHFNMSTKHNLFGSEVWISAFDEYYSKGLSFGKIHMDSMEEIGLYSRGIKTKLMNSKVADYYGIIRESRNVGVPCALIEHCHLDEKRDEGYYESTDKLEELGRIDATSVAKYFKLKSEILGVDYSDYPVEEVPLPNQIMGPDKTNPEICSFRELSCNRATGEIKVALTAKDSDSQMLYYSYSLNGGITWSKLYPWEKNQDTLILTVKIQSGRSLPQLIFRAHNLYDKYTISNQKVYARFDY